VGFGFDTSKFTVFICYHENERPEKNNVFAEIIHDFLDGYGVNSFIAHLERSKYSEVFDQVRKEILTISTCKYFIFINTQGSLKRDEVIKEFNIAFPSALETTPKLLVLRHNSAQLTDPEFESKTGISLKGYNQAKFEDEGDLVKVTRNMLKTYDFNANIPSGEDLQKELKLKNILDIECH
jgi:hypothetical protein